MNSDRALPTKAIGGPRNILGLAAQLIFKPGFTLLNACQELKDRFGDVLQIRIPFLPPTYQITDPDLIGRILMGTEKSNHKSKFFERLKILLGEGLLTAEGDLWKTNRRLSNPAFHPRMLDTFCQLIEAETLKMVDNWKARIKIDPILDMSEEMNKLAFTFIGKALFTVDV
mgnify:CR=1 FL=1